MFARVVECRSKAGRSDQVGNKLDNEVLPILQKQPGSVDFLTAFRQGKPRKANVHQFLDLTRRCRGISPPALLLDHRHVKASLGVSPTLKTFAVNASTAHRIAVARAA